MLRLVSWSLRGQKTQNRKYLPNRIVKNEKKQLPATRRNFPVRNVHSPPGSKGERIFSKKQTNREQNTFWAILLEDIGSEVRGRLSIFISRKRNILEKSLLFYTVPELRIIIIEFLENSLMRSMSQTSL